MLPPTGTPNQMSIDSDKTLQNLLASSNDDSLKQILPTLQNLSVSSDNTFLKKILSTLQTSFTLTKKIQSALDSYSSSSTANTRKRKLDPSVTSAKNHPDVNNKKIKSSKSEGDFQEGKRHKKLSLEEKECIYEDSQKYRKRLEENGEPKPKIKDLAKKYNLPKTTFFNIQRAGDKKRGLPHSIPRRTPEEKERIYEDSQKYLKRLEENGEPRPKTKDLAKKYNLPRATLYKIQRAGDKKRGLPVHLINKKYSPEEKEFLCKKFEMLCELSNSKEVQAPIQAEFARKNGINVDTFRSMLSTYYKRKNITVTSGSKPSLEKKECGCSSSNEAPKIRGEQFLQERNASKLSVHKEVITEDEFSDTTDFGSSLFDSLPSEELVSSSVLNKIPDDVMNNEDFGSFSLNSVQLEELVDSFAAEIIRG